MDEHKYVVCMETPQGKQVTYGPFDSVEEVGKWAATAAINVEYWTCERLYSPESAPLTTRQPPVLTRRH